MDLVIPISKDKASKAILKVLSSFQNLSNYEINVLSTMIDKNITLLDTSARREIREHLGTDQYTFNNYISKLRNKKALVEDPSGSGLSVHPGILEAVKNKKINVAFDIVE